MKNVRANVGYTYIDPATGKRQVRSLPAQIGGRRVLRKTPARLMQG